jgi:hypothetical protein
MNLCNFFITRMMFYIYASWCLQKNNSYIRKLEDSYQRVIKSHKLKDRKYNVQTKNKKTKNYRENTIQKTEEWAAQTSLKTRGKHMCSIRVSSSWSTSGTCRVTLTTNLVIVMTSNPFYISVYISPSLIRPYFRCTEISSKMAPFKMKPPLF